ncbi:hypothetical protein [Propionibacterium australiense]|uniref:hypothetical protein n=1 Tax=Propionibacterium australiense TaxID=119981 RepID=UPI000F823F52|nr:hypothetical protein [Propionibacterium australiense]
MSDKYSAPRQVLDAALFAWSIHGEACQVRDITDKAPGLFALLFASHSRQFEFIIDARMNEVSWTLLSQWPRFKTYKFRALVPRSSLNLAREYLYQSDFELQSWWIEHDRVFFGTMETV